MIWEEGACEAIPNSKCWTISYLLEKIVEVELLIDRLSLNLMSDEVKGKQMRT